MKSLIKFRGEPFRAEKHNKHAPVMAPCLSQSLKNAGNNIIYFKSLSNFNSKQWHSNVKNRKLAYVFFEGNQFLRAEN